MRRPYTQLVCLAAVAIGTLSSFKALTSYSPATTPAEGDETAQATPKEEPHSRPPVGVSLTETEGAWLRAPSGEWFARQAELNPGRYTLD